MNNNRFTNRHIGPRREDIAPMLKTIGVNSISELIEQTIPHNLISNNALEIDDAISEQELLSKMRILANSNKIFKTYIGMGYYNTVTPSVIVRNVLENPVWYTSYTPYQAEISQGRLEALLNFQTMIVELTGMDVANASLLDEATAAAEALVLMYNTRNKHQQSNNIKTCLIDELIWPQTRAVIETRALGLGINVEFTNILSVKYDADKHFGVIIQYPNSKGEICDYNKISNTVHKSEGKVAVATDLLALTLLKPPGQWGADITFGSSQRFGIPMAYGGPHAAFFATVDSLKRFIPGRIIGVTKDVNGKRALRMALQTREQHIKREKATSNICTAQALLATMASFYAVYNGSKGLIGTASRIHSYTIALEKALSQMGIKQLNNSYFDTIRFKLPKSLSLTSLRKNALKSEINLLYSGINEVGISIDETVTTNDLIKLINLIANCLNIEAPELIFKNENKFPNELERTTPFLEQEVFNKYHSETEMMRYIKRLERKDISLAHSMIPLGSCTMKLNASTAMMPITWPEFSALHPFIPSEQALGYHQMMNELRSDLSKITGLPHVSLQPNSGAMGEYAGLMIIKAYHESCGEANRNIALIPSSAHGTNPASAVMAGLKVEIVKCDMLGNVDMDDLKLKSSTFKDNLACLMITYPSTHGVFEHKIKEACNIVHKNGGQVYMDGANMNAQVGLTSPGFIGADVCHLNLHKTFAIPHGGGGPGVGPISVASHLSDFLPGHPVIDNKRSAILAIAAAPWGSAGVLPITYAYIKMMGKIGLREASEMAIMNANYIASALSSAYKVLYKGENKRVAHELIIDCREFKNMAGITETDIAKRLIDYGFHAPTLSFPVAGTLMIEPTESESKEELDRFIEAMFSIFDEIKEVANGSYPKDDNVLVNSPHSQYQVVSDEWKYPYSRQKAAFPLKWVEENKFWVNTARIDNAYGDRNLVCTCNSIIE